MLTLKVTGMTCEHCVRAITQAVRAIPGTQDVTIDLASGKVSVTGDPDVQAVRHAIAEEGYEVVA